MWFNDSLFGDILDDLIRISQTFTPSGIASPFLDRPNEIIQESGNW
jgi:hypothetical protein